MKTGIEAQGEIREVSHRGAADSWALVEGVLQARQERAERLHDILLEAREALRARLTPDTQEDRAIYEKVQAAIYIVRGDPVDMHLRAALAALPPSPVSEKEG